MTFLGKTSLFFVDITRINQCLSHPAPPPRECRLRRRRRRRRPEELFRAEEDE
jgi:hypothetical protein